METMRAVVQDTYGPPEALGVTRIPVPVARPDQALVRVRAAGIDAGTWHLTTGEPLLMRVIGMGFRGPKARVRGLAFAGEIVETGERVFGVAPGALAEFVAVDRSSLVAMPPALTFDEAAALPVSAVTALQAVRAAAPRPGDGILVLGAAGGVGHYVVQLAVAAGAHVTGVCSAPKAAFVRELGANETIDYATTDVLALPRLWDAIVDTAGDRPLAALRRILAPTGALVLVGGTGGRILGGTDRVAAAAMRNAFARQRLVGLLSRDTAADLAEVASLVADGSLRPVLDATYPLEEAGAAIAQVGAGRARGKVVVTV
ncbi:NAD(P)-dependent alcohol dehydrogenase [Leifsonia sp. NPDC058194]|uniref:NAD(P)-dependent alcohol dehydrogenase n=1 Tax=Leifsonia sp. NPDC058194 TaxID=3346374 RepID=UPI0036D8BB97